MSQKFKKIDRSGAVGIEATGMWFGEVVENITRGLFGLMCGSSIGDKPVHRTFTVLGDGREGLLADWLDEVLKLSLTHRELYGRIEVVTASPTRIKGHLYGEPIDTSRHEMRLDIKAACRDDVLVEQDGEDFLARVTFDS